MSTTRNFIALLIILIQFLPRVVTAQNFTITGLQCEHLTNPLGIDAASPRLQWRMEDTSAGAVQTACMLFVGTDSLAVLQAKAGTWQTEKINTSAQLIVYSGAALQPFTKYYWAVKAWNKKEEQALSPVASFETGMMDMHNWQGSWITDTRDINLKPAPYFRETFAATKKIIAARAYIAVAGLYELYINGTRIGNYRLDPMYTRFDRRTLYVTYDITPQMQQGINTAGVLLGNGWYNHQSTAVWYFHEAPWRARPSFCMDIKITYDDGTTATITSGKDWKTALSPVIFNSIYTGEHYDARKEIPHWNEPAFNDSAWKEVIYVAAPSQYITAQALQPVRHVETIQAATMQQLSDTVYVFNLGRNIAGVSSLTVSGETGTVVRLKHGERLYPDGRVDQSNIDAHYRPTDDKDPFQTDIYLLKGGTTETFMPRFNYKGFQYVEVTGSKPLKLTRESLTAYFMHSDVQPAGSVSTSNNTINRIWSATNNAYLSNLFGYPTDCPQREKNGWTGDAQIAIETGLYNFDAITIYEKWLADHRDEQQPNGVLPSIVPTGGWGYEWGNGPDWTSTIAIIPWNIYLFYGDSKLLADCYDNIKRYVDHIDLLYPAGLTSWGLGDWIPVKSKAPVELTSTAYYFADVVILSKAARLFGREEDYKKYHALAGKIKTAFNNKYLDTATAIYGSGLQTELSVALFWGLVPDNLRTAVAANLAKRVQADSMRLDVGLLGTKAILNALSENGYAGIAYKLAANEQYPSWGWWIKNGATTLYENWPIDAKSDISMNHIMFGEIGAWLYKALGGIKPDEHVPGFKHILLQPYFAEGLDSCNVTHQSPYGIIKSLWKRAGKKITYTVTVPPNATATLTLKPGKNQQVFLNNVRQLPVAGTYQASITAGTHTIELK